MALIGLAFGMGFTFGPLIGAMFVSGDSGPSPMPGYVASGLSAFAFLWALVKLPESLRAGSTPAEHHWLQLSTLKDAIARPSIGMVLATMFMTDVYQGLAGIERGRVKYLRVMEAMNLNWDDTTVNGWNETNWTNFRGERTWVNNGDGEFYGIELTTSFAVTSQH